jgi:dolichol-phosphate mannosyltransferase
MNTGALRSDLAWENGQPSGRRPTGPDLSACEGGARTCDTLVALATYNEGETIGPLIDAILGLPISVDVVVIDDRSLDRTRTEVERRSAADKRVGMIERPCKLGIGSAHRLGWLHARRRGYARIVTLDADLSHDPADIPRLLAMLDRGADFVIGSRFAPGGSLDYRGFRRVISRGANLLARRLLRLTLTEHTTSLRAARLDRVPPGLVETVDHEGYAFFLASIRQVVRAGLNVVEIPIHFHDRQHGSSKLPPIEIVHGLMTLLRLTYLGKRAAPFRELSDHVCPSCDRAYCVRAPVSRSGWRCLACSGAKNSGTGDFGRAGVQSAVSGE